MVLKPWGNFRGLFRELATNSHRNDRHLSLQTLTRSGLFDPPCSCSQSILILKSLRRVRTLRRLRVSQGNFVWGGNSVNSSWEMEFLFCSLSRIEPWLHGPPQGWTLPLPPARGRKALGLSLCNSTLLTVQDPDSASGHENTISPDQTHSALLILPWWHEGGVCFQEGRSLFASFPLEVNSTGTALWKHPKLNLWQDSHHPPPRVAHICSWAIACFLILPVQPCKPGHRLAPFVCPQTVHLRMINSPVLLLLGWG